MSFSLKLYMKGVTGIDWSDDNVWMKVSLLMIIALEDTLRLTVASQYCNSGLARFSPFWADDVHLLFAHFLMESHLITCVFQFDS